MAANNAGKIKGSMEATDDEFGHHPHLRCSAGGCVQSVDRSKATGEMVRAEGIYEPGL